MAALTCPRCGAPLPVTAAAEQAVVCAWCGATITTAGAQPASSPPPLRDADVQPARQRFALAVAAALQAGATPFDALRRSAGDHLGTFGQSDAVARVALALAADVESASGAHVAGDPLALSRIAEAYLQALEGIRATGTAQLHLPFLAATSSGPVDLRRTLTAAVVSELAARDPQPAPRKRRRLFG